MSPKQHNMILNVRKMLTGFFLMKKEFEGLQNKVKPFRILKKKQTPCLNGIYLVKISCENVGTRNTCK